MKKQNEVVEAVVVEELELTEVEKAKLVLKQARKEKIDEGLAKAKEFGKKSMKVVVPTLAVGGIVALAKKAKKQEVEYIENGEFEVIEFDDKEFEELVESGEIGE